MTVLATHNAEMVSYIGLVLLARMSTVLRFSDGILMCSTGPGQRFEDFTERENID